MLYLENGSGICYAFNFITQYVGQVNILCILPITIDRLCAVLLTYQYRNRKCQKLIVRTITICWMIPILTVGIVFTSRLFTYSNTYYTNRACLMKPCTIANQTMCLALNIVGHIIVVLVPLIFNLISYIAIIRQLYKLRTRINSRVAVIAGKAILTTVIFSSSWLPFYLTIYLSDKVFFLKSSRITTILLYMNTLSDPILYLVPLGPFINSLRRVNEFLMSFIPNSRDKLKASSSLKELNKDIIIFKNCRSKMGDS